MADREFKHYMVWTGSAWWPTWAVSEKKAMNNVCWRMRQMGKFPQRYYFEARQVNEPAGQARAAEGVR